MSIHGSLLIWVRKLEFKVKDPIHFLVGQEAKINKIEARDLTQDGPDILPQ
jgi:hypothetical protein